eukprot:c30487_g1_i1 orf=2-163(+)
MLLDPDDSNKRQWMSHMWRLCLLPIEKGNMHAACTYEQLNYLCLSWCLVAVIA